MVRSTRAFEQNGHSANPPDIERLKHVRTHVTKLLCSEESNRDLILFSTAKLVDIKVLFLIINRVRDNVFDIVHILYMMASNLFVGGIY